MGGGDRQGCNSGVWKLYGFGMETVHTHAGVSPC